jgi:signal transduction histidine kinase
MAIMTFTDSGSGISLEIQNKIMLPFFTTKEVGKGTGLGLSISKSIIEKLNGKFYYDSENKNTCFIIELPVSPKIPKKEIS